MLGSSLGFVKQELHVVGLVFVLDASNKGQTFVLVEVEEVGLELVDSGEGVLQNELEYSNRKSFSDYILI